ncbi:MAG: hypothetical protein VX288_00035, partial [Planctomycetota bacterium]|nr:hypothetical protein [Planctomycetota bacterium]
TAFIGDSAFLALFAFLRQMNFHHEAPRLTFFLKFRENLSAIWRRQYFTETVHLSPLAVIFSRTMEQGPPKTL